MTRQREASVGATPRVSPVLATDQAIARHQPIGGEGVTITGGFWAERQRINREQTIPHGFEQLRQAGNLNNLRLAAGADGRYHTLGQSIGLEFPFLDTDVYKWLEAAAWTLGQGPDPDLRRDADEAIGLIEAAQRPDGYLNSFVQVVAPGREYQDLAWGHELYCVGHLIQAAVAWQRAVGDARLLRVAVRAADSVDRVLGPTGRLGVDGHPEIEMALVELYRATGERRYLELAARMVDARGHGMLGPGRFGPAYWQDHEPVSTATSVAGHAVRQLYLDAGAVDVATELGDSALLAVVHRRWQDMIATRTYLTGGVGSRHLDEAFGDPFELPPDRAYAETCGAIASVMLAWRLLLATGDPACAEVIERTVYNGVLPGVSLAGTRFFYDNPLQRRTHRAAAAAGHGERASWFPCACCPPNLMRLLGSWQQYLATTTDEGIAIHQFATADIRVEQSAGTIRLAIRTDYPWDGTVSIEVVETPESAWSLSLRIPRWARTATIRGMDGSVWPVSPGEPWSTGSRTWRAGDSLQLDLDLQPRVSVPDARIDAIRDCVALERGPLVYCLESVDLPAGVAIEEVRLDPAVRPNPVQSPDLEPSIVALELPALRQRPAPAAWPYREPGIDERPADAGDGAGETAITVRAVPYFAWANRAVRAMRVWIPLGSKGRDTRQ